MHQKHPPAKTARALVGVALRAGATAAVARLAPALGAAPALAATAAPASDPARPGLVLWQLGTAFLGNPHVGPNGRSPQAQCPGCEVAASPGPNTTSPGGKGGSITWRRNISSSSVRASPPFRR